MSGDYVRWLATESAAAARHDQSCPECGGKGYVEGPGCNCGVGPSGYYGMHERYCGLEPCPRGCPFVAPGTVSPGKAGE